MTLKDYRLQEFYDQYKTEKLKAKKRKETFFAALEWILITLMIGAFICLTKIL
tara:strand:- start:2800 stop:2958 length:159 start_codon:yes stop_codon:yes gene_type:complete